MLKKATNYLLPALVFLILVSLLHWPLQLNLIFLWVGVLAGVLLFELDSLLSLRLQLQRRVLHSVLVQLILLAAFFFVLTSSSSLLGKGLVLGLFLHTLIDQGLAFRREGKIDDWFWQFKIVPNTGFQKLYFIVLAILFLVFSLVWI